MITPGLDLSGICASVYTLEANNGIIPSAYFGYAHSILMTFAMMLPLAIPVLTKSHTNSEQFRNTSMLVFVGVFVGIWCAVMLFLEFLTLQLPIEQIRFELLLMTGLFSAAWHTTPSRVSAVEACKNMEIAGTNTAGEQQINAALRSGAFFAGNCVKSCLPIMALSCVLGHALLPTIVLTVIVWSERLQARPFQMASTFAILGVTFGAAALVISL